MTQQTQGVRLGEIMVSQQLLTTAEVQQILSVQRQQGRPFGVLAEQLFGINPRAVESAWVRQYGVLTHVAEPTRLPIEPDCIKLLNRRQAWQFQMATVNHDGGELVILTDEKHLSRALRFAAETFREPTFFRITSEEKLQAFLCEHYPAPDFMIQMARTF